VNRELHPGSTGPTPHLCGAEVGECVAGFDVGDATHLDLGNKCVHAVIGSPPYLAARTYGIKAQRGMRDWLDFMLACTCEGLRVSTGPVLWVIAGTTKKNRYTPGPEALMYEAWKQGIELYRPLCWLKKSEPPPYGNGGGCGTPGSGGRDWFRGDWEYVVCFKNPGPLPWSNPLFQCRRPKFQPGGRMRNRQANGRREQNAYKLPTWANPGNVVYAKVGGGRLGDKEAYQNEAPYPEVLAAHLIQAVVPPGGWVYDPFSGSGTTVVEAVRLGRNGYGTDLRADQVQLGYSRLLRRIKEGRAQDMSPGPWPHNGPRGAAA
jgi:hypothetical protein